ncbi:MAG: alpha/beta hydrolase [Pirellulales bacterium]|nr:alpha/beta hydrolase [Pirellulales bacterium]
MTRCRHLRIVTLAAIACLASRAAWGQTTYQEPKRVVYATGVDKEELSLNVLVPKGKANGLGVIFVMSGAGYSADGKDTEREHQVIADTFCGRGYTVFAVRPGPITKYSVIDMADHLQKAIVFIKAHADQYKVDAGRLGLMSTRGGVHLVCLVCITATDKTAPKAAGVYIPPTDLNDKDTQKLYIQADTAAWEQIRKEAFNGGDGISPSSSAPFAAGAKDPQIKLPRVSPLAPTFLIVHGDADPSIPRLDSNAFFAAMRDADVAHDMVVKRPGTTAAPTIRAEIGTLADWFDKQLRLD